jgi:hypothetical protein
MLIANCCLGQENLCSRHFEGKLERSLQCISRERGSDSGLRVSLSSYNTSYLHDSSSGRMPQAVRNALAEIFSTEGRMSLSDAEEYLDKMEKTERYKQETW